MTATRKDIAAFTADECSYPAFVAIYDHGDAVVVTLRGKRVRNEAKGCDFPGPLAEIRLTHDEWAKIVADAAAYKRGG